VLLPARGKPIGFPLAISACDASATSQLVCNQIGDYSPIQTTFERLLAETRAPAWASTTSVVGAGGAASGEAVIWPARTRLSGPAAVLSGSFRQRSQRLAAVLHARQMSPSDRVLAVHCSAAQIPVLSVRGRESVHERHSKVVSLWLSEFGPERLWSKRLCFLLFLAYQVLVA